MNPVLQPDAIRSIAIVGGGTAGWVAASMLARALPATGIVVTLVESPEIRTVGVGEATIPPILDLLRFLSINEADFLQYTKATYKLGIKFRDWHSLGSSYWHPFGTFGAVINRRPFFHAWHKAVANGVRVSFNDFSLCSALGDADQFRFPDPRSEGPLAGVRYALHFDASLVAKYLRIYAERLGVIRLEGKVVEATQRADGAIDELVLGDGRRLQADLYLDCSGFRGLLIEQTLKTGYLDWRSMLPCDRAVAVQTYMKTARTPYTQAVAHEAGWRWRIPLQHRAGNGYVFSSGYLDDNKATDTLLRAVGEQTVVDPWILSFVTGRRRQFWNRNCIALGLASGFLEPLESTSIHLMVSGVYRLLEHFPDRSFDQRNTDSYNREVITEFEHVRDFIVLHYCLTRRDDTPFWRYCSSMPIPDSLRERIDLYRATGRIRPRAGELFTDLSWFYIFEGLGVRPASYDPMLDVVSGPELGRILQSLSQATALAMQGAPSHDSYFGPPETAVRQAS